MKEEAVGWQVCTSIESIVSMKNELKFRNLSSVIEIFVRRKRLCQKTDADFMLVALCSKGLRLKTTISMEELKPIALQN